MCFTEWYLHCFKCLPGPTHSYHSISDNIPHEVIYNYVTILQLPICTAQSLHLFSQPQNSLPSDNGQSIPCIYESVSVVCLRCSLDSIYK